MRQLLQFVLRRAGKGDLLAGIVNDQAVVWHGHKAPADAEDLTQGFFAYLLDGDFLERPDPAKGRFRGYLVGALILTLWMRALSILGIRYGVVSIAIPLAALAAVAGFLLWRRDRDDLQRAARDALEAIPFPPDLRGTARVAWRLLLAWVALRFVLLGLYVAWQPLYPWEAWTQWATKARVWYELGHLVPFVGSKAWF